MRDLAWALGIPIGALVVTIALMNHYAPRTPPSTICDFTQRLTVEAEKERLSNMSMVCVTAHWAAVEDGISMSDDGSEAYRKTMQHYIDRAERKLK